MANRRLRTSMIVLIAICVGFVGLQLYGFLLSRRGRRRVEPARGQPNPLSQDGEALQRVHTPSAALKLDVGLKPLRNESGGSNPGHHTLAQEQIEENQPAFRNNSAEHHEQKDTSKPKGEEKVTNFTSGRVGGQEDVGKQVEKNGANLAQPDSGGKTSLRKRGEANVNATQDDRNKVGEREETSEHKVGASEDLSRLQYSTQLTWQIANDFGPVLFIGSAHEQHVSEQKSIIRVIAETAKAMPTKVGCVFLDRDHKSLSSYAASSRSLGGTSRRSWVTIECAWHETAAFVNITHGSKAITVPIQRAPRTASGFAACVSPTFRYDRASKLRTFLEYYTFAGARKIYLYKHSWSNETERVAIQHAAKHPGQLTVFPWWNWDWTQDADRAQWAGVPGMPQLDTYKDFQQLSMNHCALQSHSDGVRFSAHIDIDERLFARKAAPLQGWAPRLLEERFAHACAVNVRSSYTEPCGIVGVRDVIHSHSWEYPHGERSKEITDNAAVAALDVHSVRACLSKTRANAEPGELFLFHQNDGNLCKGVWPCGDGFSRPEPAFTRMISPFCHEQLPPPPKAKDAEVQ